MNEQLILSLLGREKQLFDQDVSNRENELLNIISSSRFLVLGGAGSIGQAVVKEIFKRNPNKLHVVDISENNLVELVRDIRATYGYISGEFKTYCIDIGSIEYDAFIRYDGQYDYVLNLSALKHVRSERDPFTLMRMIDVNIINTLKTIEQSANNGVTKYFCVSTDKAANPTNMMGASKRIMEKFLMSNKADIKISTARFANVAFSDGSLLYSFKQRIQKIQPIVAPNDVKRYFVTPKESGELCLMSCIFGENKEIFFPKLRKDFNLISLAEIAKNYLLSIGYDPYICTSEDEARLMAKILPNQGKWPCLFSESDTTGEKHYEEFFTDTEIIDNLKFKNFGIIKFSEINENILLENFLEVINTLKKEKQWSKEQLIGLFQSLIPEFSHNETGKYLDGKM